MNPAHNGKSKAEIKVEILENMIEEHSRRLYLQNTELERINQKLNLSNRELECFAYVASHDLQEPLRMVASYVQLLKKRYSRQLDKDALEFIDFAYDGATRMKEMINALLAYSRVDHMADVSAEVDLNRIVRAALQNLQEVIRERRVMVEVGPLPLVQGNPAMMTQLFQNIIGNGIKFVRDKVPEIRIHHRLSHPEHMVSVQDNGIGIEKKYFEKIFLLFQRLHKRDEFEGSGIGLAICKKIIELHHGRLQLQSEPGRGTTFEIYFPMVRSERRDETA